MCVQALSSDEVSTVRPNMDQISIFGSFLSCEMACDNNRFNNGAAMWLVLVAMKKTAAAFLTACLTLRSRSSHVSVNDWTLPSYVMVVNHIWSHSTDDMIDHTYTKNVRFNHRANMSAQQYTDALCMNILGFRQRYKEYVLKETFVEGW